MASFFPLKSKGGRQRHVLYGSMLCGDPGWGQCHQVRPSLACRRCTAAVRREGSPHSCMPVWRSQEAWVGDFDPEAEGDKLVNVTDHVVLDFGLWYAAKGTTPLDLDPTTHVVFGW